jgi:sortase A
MSIRFLRILGRVLILAGALALAYSAYLHIEELWWQRIAGHAFEQQISKVSGIEESRKLVRDQRTRPHPGGVLGRIEIARIHLSALVLEGSDPHMLRIGAGHIRGTALPGTMGNIGIAAHRDTFFRPLREIRHNDTIALMTPYGVYQYQVESTEIVDPTEARVLDQTRHLELTLVTCYPFHYVGSAPKRFIVHARLQADKLTNM